MEEAASSFAGGVVKLQTASVALLQCVADSWWVLLEGLLLVNTLRNA
jgi:hypothetical protein